METITVKLTIDRAALNEALGNVSAVPLDKAVRELIEGALAHPGCVPCQWCDGISDPPVAGIIEIGGGPHE